MGSDQLSCIRSWYRFLCSRITGYNPTETIQIEHNRLVLSGGENPDGGSKTNSIVVPINPTNNLPTLLGHRVDAVPKLPNALNAVVSVVHKDNYNLSPAEKEWLKWHYRLGHVGFKRVQFLMRSGVLAKSPPMRSLHTTIAKLTTPPKCAACLFAKAKRRSPAWTNDKTDGSRCKGRGYRMGILTIFYQCQGNEQATDKVWWGTGKFKMVT